LKGRGGGPEHQFCDFKRKQFSSDGRRLYYLTPAWATSDALHAFDMRAGEENFLLPANDVLVLNFCRSKYKDHLIVLIAIFSSAAAMTGTGFTIRPAKRSLDRSANSPIGKT
jgi:hypothetical protein